MKWKILGPVSYESDNWEGAISRRFCAIFLNWLGERDCYCTNFRETIVFTDFRLQRKHT